MIILFGVNVTRLLVILLFVYSALLSFSDVLAQGWNILLCRRIFSCEQVTPSFLKIFILTFTAIVTYIIDGGSKAIILVHEPRSIFNFDILQSCHDCCTSV